MKFGQYFKKLRISKQITQKNIAQIIGKTEMTVSGVETGKIRSFSDKDLNKIAAFMCLSENEKKIFFKNAAFSQGKLPVYLQNYITSRKEVYEILELIFEAKPTNDTLKQIIKYVKEITNV